MATTTMQTLSSSNMTPTRQTHSSTDKLTLTGLRAALPDSPPMTPVRGHSPAPSPRLHQLGDRDEETEQPTASGSRYHALSGALEGFAHRRMNPIIGEVFHEALQLADVLDDDAIVRDLAITISRRGVVAFKQQQSITPDQMATLAHRLGLLVGKPVTSTLHTHPLSQTDFNEDGTPKKKPAGEQITTERDARGAQISGRDSTLSRFASAGWHTDISFEPIPANYTLLRMNVIPECGGDTLFSSSYEAYERLSEPMKVMLEGMTATHDGEVFRTQARRFGFQLHSAERGAPEDAGEDLIAVHPVVRTDPVTGWKTLNVNKTFTTRINELNRDESDMLLAYLYRLTADNHNLQARYTWQAGDLVIWSNVAVQHTATWDFDDGVKRSGDRVVGLGERPFLDPASMSRREALALEESSSA